ncbi:hypothetical protein FZ025_17000 [Xanthomonas hyacinthi]|uniref:Uncharacterized protein n=1 Tax=Xanthomonas hyacinthi TaxID=56455 RepID=A0A2S7F1L6_9XANT|nr:hypothetical protein [Xanthomonas hyacinthi]PPU99263.1 hypothetical protein XhyaCFBP1156_03060 [Xanthomonas hyacinthi]QGY78250.1 hypothetical protein FZ025_17000 [Xanthomonas hyacinthi]
MPRPPGERAIELHLALLSSADARVLATYSRALGEDAGLEPDQDALRLDTARYDLAPRARASRGATTASATDPRPAPKRRSGRSNPNVLPKACHDVCPR